MLPVVLVPLGHEGSGKPFDFCDLGMYFFNGCDIVKANHIHSNQAVNQPQPSLLAT